MPETIISQEFFTWESPSRWRYLLLSGFSCGMKPRRSTTSAKNDMAEMAAGILESHLIRGKGLYLIYNEIITPGRPTPAIRFIGQ